VNIEDRNKLKGLINEAINYLSGPVSDDDCIAAVSLIRQIGTEVERAQAVTAQVPEGWKYAADLLNSVAAGIKKECKYQSNCENKTASRLHEGWISKLEDVRDAMLAMAAAPSQQVAAPAIQAQSDLSALAKLSWTDQSTADPITKAKRVLEGLHKGSISYFFHDGYPRDDIATDSKNVLAVIEALAAPSLAQEQPVAIFEGGEDDAAPVEAKPFMHAIMEPGGTPYLDEFCVAGNAEDLHSTLNGLNDSPDAGYLIVPVYTSSQPSTAQGDESLPLSKMDTFESAANSIGFSIEKSKSGEYEDNQTAGALEIWNRAFAVAKKASSKKIQELARSGLVLMMELKTAKDQRDSVQEELDALKAAQGDAVVQQAGDEAQGDGVILSDEDCDRIAAQTIDAVAQKLGLHGLEVNTDVRSHNTLRRALVRAALAQRPTSAAPSDPRPLFDRKLADLQKRGYEVIGRILHKEGEYALFDSCCRWLTTPQYQRLMHEQDGSLFADKPTSAAPEQKPFAYFVQPSSFGPFIECESSQAGAFPAFRQPTSAADSEDAARLEWMCQRGARIAWSMDGESCNVWLPCERGGEEERPAEGWPQIHYAHWRPAIDAARNKEAQKGGAA